MASEKQIAANTANALKSTGPRTQEGKLASRSNALVHGLTAETVIIQGESAEAFNALRADLLDEYLPKGAVEECLVEQMASTIWRWRRVPVIEAAVMDWLDYLTQFRPAPQTWISTKDADGRPARYIGPIPDYHKVNEPGKERFRLGRQVEAALKRDVPGKLGRYEKHLFNQFTKITDKLSALQVERGSKQQQFAIQNQSPPLPQAEPLASSAMPAEPEPKAFDLAAKANTAGVSSTTPVDLAPEPEADTQNLPLAGMSLRESLLAKRANGRLKSEPASNPEAES